YGARPAGVLVGIGDDAAVLAIEGGLVATTDALVEGHDFWRRSDPTRLGRKSLAVNLSDVAAMGAAPLHALLTLGLPKWATLDWLDAFLEGFRSMAREHGVALVGGDLSASPFLFVSVTVLGRPPAPGALRRDGARPGETLYLAGTLGAATAGLALAAKGYRLEDGRVRGPKGRLLSGNKGSEAARLIRHQVDPRPMVALGRSLAEERIASAALDVSDGLARDLHRLCRASGVGAVVDGASLPVDSALFDLHALTGVAPRTAALFGGEDYGLLFAVPRRKLADVERLARRFALRRIGTLDASGRVTVDERGRVTPLPDAGFDHFAGRKA
ncbi:MAG TPA: thiamine-phosphate kinase, partial [Thermoanaerobaculia bacterium]|nr:thiamine-phosphate kinase [Thermoanaerobaculia bacterium]